MSRSTVSQPADMAAFQGRGVVERAISPLTPGRVYFQASSWPARLFQPDANSDLLPGAPVEVVGRESLTLLVKPLS